MDREEPLIAFLGAEVDGQRDDGVIVFGVKVSQGSLSAVEKCCGMRNSLRAGISAQPSLSTRRAEEVVVRAVRRSAGVVGVVSAHHGEPDVIAVPAEELWEAAASGHRADVQVGEALSP